MYDENMFKGLGQAFAAMGCLSVIGLLAILAASGYGVYWLVNHVSIAVRY